MAYFTVNQLRIFYRVKGVGKPLIFLHGIFAESEIYSELINILSKFYKVYAIDMPFHGKSENLKGYWDINTFVTFLHDIVIKLRLKNPILCGHSAGGFMAIKYAAKYQTHKILLLNPSGAPSNMSFASFLLKAFLVKSLNSIKINAAKFFLIKKYVLRNVIRNLFNFQYFLLLKRSLRAGVIKDMQQVKCPTYILWSSRDEEFPISYAKIFLKNIKDSKLIKVKGNHDWPILQPEGILKFLQS